MKVTVALGSNGHHWVKFMFRIINVFHNRVVTMLLPVSAEKVSILFQGITLKQCLEKTTGHHSGRMATKKHMKVFSSIIQCYFSKNIIKKLVNKILMNELIKCCQKKIM